VAGAGTFFFSRALGARTLAAIFAGTAFELSGAFTGWLGWPQAGVFAFLGFVLLATVLTIRHRRLRDVVLLAVSLALACYGGHPESIVITFLVLGIFALVLLSWLAVGQRRSGGGLASLARCVGRPFGTLVLGVVAGIGLAAPLLLPLHELVSGSARTSQGGYVALPRGDAVALAFQGFDGLPIAGGHYFGLSNYYDVAGYVGVAVLVFAVVATGRAWRRAEVAGLALVGLLCAAILYLPSVAHLVDQVPQAGGVLWYRALIPLDFVLAVLAGLGLHEFLEWRKNGRGAVIMTTWVWSAAAVLVLVLFLRFLGQMHRLTPGGASERLESFVWPALEVTVGLVTSGLMLLALRTRAIRRTRRWWTRERLAGLALLAVESGFLLWAGAPLWSSQAQYFPPTTGERALVALAGSSRIGFGNCPSIDGVANLGILPNANLAYKVAELAFYDPIAPRTYYESWALSTGHPVPVPPTGVFCPSITTVKEARQYGVGEILEPPGSPGPTGSVLIGRPGGEGLYRVGGVALASETPATPIPKTSAERLLTVEQPNPSTWQVPLDTARPSVVRLRLTDVAGWRATVNGRAAALSRWHKVMLEVRVPAGRDVVTLRYDPGTFNDGLVLALLSAGGLVIAWVVALNRRRQIQRRVRVD
jgi:hypothetical protein